LLQLEDVPEVPILDETESTWSEEQWLRLSAALLKLTPDVICQSDGQHLEVFHQAEAFWLDGTSKIDPWQFTGRILQSVSLMLPESTVRIVPTQYGMCSQAWELEIERQDRSWEVIAWGMFTNKIVSQLGVDSSRFAAIGVCYGLKRLAGLRHGINDIRKVESAIV